LNEQPYPLKVGEGVFIFQGEKWPFGAKIVRPAAHGPVTPRSHWASGAVPGHIGSEPGSRCTLGHKVGPRVPRRFLTGKLCREVFRSIPGSRTGLPGALLGCAEISAGASAHSTAPPDGNQVQVPCFKKTLLPTNFVEVLRLFGW
jgi:hypothetical protein